MGRVLFLPYESDVCVLKAICGPETPIVKNVPEKWFYPYIALFTVDP